MNNNVYVVGLAQAKFSPLSRALETNIYHLTSFFKDYAVVIYATGDGTLSSLNEWKKRDPKVNILLESEHFPTDGRTSNLVYGRNKLKDVVYTMHHESKRNSTEEAFLVILDLDDANQNEFNTTIFANAMKYSNEWDVLTFNRRRYYDIWALRYPHIDVNVWSFGDDSKPMMALLQRDIARQLDITKRQSKRFLPVYSAFSGIGVYKLRMTAGCSYSQEASFPYEPSTWLSKKGKKIIGPQGECEHVPFHACIRAKHEARIVISPEYIHTTRSLADKPAQNWSALGSSTAWEAFSNTSYVQIWVFCVVLAAFLARRLCRPGKSLVR